MPWSRKIIPVMCLMPHVKYLPHEVIPDITDRKNLNLQIKTR